jgi:hypothetical protein
MPQAVTLSIARRGGVLSSRCHASVGDRRTQAIMAALSS